MQKKSTLGTFAITVIRTSVDSGINRTEEQQQEGRYVRLGKDQEMVSSRVEELVTRKGEQKQTSRGNEMVSILGEEEVLGRGEKVV